VNNTQPIPDYLQPTWIDRLGMGHVLLGLVLLVYPAVASPFFLTQIGGYTMIMGTLGLSLMMLAGYGGMVSLAQITVAGIAGYAIAVFGVNATGIMGFGWPWWIATPYAILIAAVTSALIGWISARTEGVYTIMITLAIAMAMYYFTQQNYALFNGHSGYSGIPMPAFWDVVWRDPVPFYYVCLGIAVFSYSGVLYARSSTFGLTLQALRDNPRRMRAIGYDVTAHKVFAWFIAGVIAGLAGVLLVWFNGRISPGTIGANAAIDVLIIAVLGGLRHPIGAFIGALVVVLLKTFAIDLIGADRFNTLIGLVFLAIVFASPDGLLGLWERFRSKLENTSVRPGL